jgi:hypothetical protein
LPRFELTVARFNALFKADDREPIDIVWPVMPNGGFTLSFEGRQLDLAAMLLIWSL